MIKPKALDFSRTHFPAGTIDHYCKPPSPRSPPAPQPSAGHRERSAGGTECADAGGVARHQGVVVLR